MIHVVNVKRPKVASKTRLQSSFFFSHFAVMDRTFFKWPKKIKSIRSC